MSRRLRRPAEGYPPAPVGGWLYRVAYCTPRGMTQVELFRFETAALDHAERVITAGGNPRIDRLRLHKRQWEHLDQWSGQWQREAP